LVCFYLDVPFFFYWEIYYGDGWLIDEEIYCDITFTTAGAHTFKIEYINPETSTYHTLDEKFIPNTIARQDEIDELENGINKLGKIYFATCNDFAHNTEKSITINNFEFIEGSMVAVKFIYGTLYGITELKVNGTTYPVYWNDSKEFSYEIPAGAIQLFIYSGGKWYINYWEDSFSTSLAKKGFVYGTCSTTPNSGTNSQLGITIYHYKVDTLNKEYNAFDTGSIISVKFDYDIYANSTLNFNDSAEDIYIYYKNELITNGVIKAGDTATFMLEYTGEPNSMTYHKFHLLSIDRWGESDLTAIPLSEIDEICGASITPASEVEL
jgi:hypothetical protein